MLKNIKRVLIANRGEIAVRAIRALKELGVESVAVYSTADKNSIHKDLADIAICIGDAPSSKSYLNIPAILSAIELTGADAVYPGYGFLAENYTFASICEKSNIKFVGPSSSALKLTGDKALARKAAEEAGVPTIPGSPPVETIEEALEVASKIGYPVLIKAAAGGGGRGMRVAHNQQELVKLLPIAQKEAEAAFSDKRVYIEKFILNPKHIEIQILADNFGNVIYLGERDCSIQRRHQKLVEEAPSIFIDEEIRKSMGEAAVRFAKHIGFTGAGTVEFIVDKDKNFYFIEMNGRIQVEHPVSELVTGIDIVSWQFKIADGQKLNIKQEDIKLNGHAIEFRINAEDSEKFTPNPGTIEKLYIPGGYGVRIDTHIYQGYTIPPYYDSLVAKLIVWGKNREEAIKRGKRALEEFILEGIKTTIPFHLKILNDKEFLKGTYTTTHVDRNYLGIKE
ncbi:acetyl-CoA carboxylase biotin carboxylase subunit [Venenivibrio stagnispumantis]|uniref:acetyl-CoA carboxylase biotin carboxylase subunit n=1 Tax=Venenivibrio stagnispumantis TaxID=407998 RepID=UPI00223663A4|nr:acetyl-CoA carboxylase biotin carboxylase subunit [Venenivibrio stagnispumantis]MCW4572977.1 acetyl-CoA carboxylase biotin carboxylase subunit [Venenivibrio stagnispumantis]